MFLEHSVASRFGTDRSGCDFYSVSWSAPRRSRIENVWTCYAHINHTDKHFRFGTEFSTIHSPWHSDRQEGLPTDGTTTQQAPLRLAYPPRAGLTDKLLILRRQYKVTMKIIPFRVSGFSNQIYWSFLEYSSILGTQIQVILYSTCHPWFPSTVLRFGCRWGLPGLGRDRETALAAYAPGRVPWCHVSNLDRGSYQRQLCESGDFINCTALAKDSIDHEEPCGESQRWEGERWLTSKFHILSLT